MIVLIAGPPGAGKTTVAAALQERFAAAGTDVRLVDSDEFSRRTDERMAERVAGSDADWLVAGTFYRSEFSGRSTGSRTSQSSSCGVTWTRTAYVSSYFDHHGE